MVKRKNRETDSFSVSFLDVASCGFGAMVILLMITKSSAPTTLESIQTISPVDSVAELQEQLFEIRGETAVLNRELNAKQEQLSANKERIARLRRDLEDIRGRFNATEELYDETIDEFGRLASAQQSLTEQMQSLLADSSETETSAIGGVPVDSEYIIFVIDTSGSMFLNAWDKMLSVIIETLNVYPEVKGIQVMNDMGQYMFNSFAGDWIDDTPRRRNQIIATLRNWSIYSDSNPAQGIIKAISTYYSPDKNISIYVLGDDFQQGGSIEQVLRQVDRINIEDGNGSRLVRIHGIAFPVLLDQPERFQRSARRYVTLMRELTRRNGGVFVLLPDYRL